MNPSTHRLLALLITLCVAGLAGHLQAQTTIFTYQGRLDDNGQPANGTYDLGFAIFDAASGGTQRGPVVTRSATAVNNGLFTVSLDFGDQFPGAGRWLEISVRAAGIGAFTTLAPRQPITATPYAVRAASAATVPPGSVTTAMLADDAVTASKIVDGAVTQLGAPDGSPSAAVQVDVNGRVGIGTPTPSAGLHLGASAPTLAPQLRSRFRSDSAANFSFAAPFDLAFSDNLLAVSDLAHSSVVLLEVRDPSVPVFRSQIKDGQAGFNNLARPRTLAFAGNLLAIGAESDHAVTLVNLSNPATPVKFSELKDGVGGFNDLESVSHVALSGSLLAIASIGDDAVSLVDVTNPASPVLRATLKDGVGGFDQLAGPTGLAFSGRLLAIAANADNAVTLVDVNNPANPVRLAVMKDESGGFTKLDGVRSVAFSANLLAICAGIENAVSLVDVTVPGTPILRKVLQNGVDGYDRLVNPLRFAFFGSLLAISSLDVDSLTLIDVANPTSPVLRGVFQSYRGGVGNLLDPYGIVFTPGGILATTLLSGDAVVFIEPVPVNVGLAVDNWVGVGTTTPTAPLHVRGNLLVDSAERVELRANRISLGLTSTASGEYSFATGIGAEATGQHSIAMGNATTASGEGSLATGTGTQASGTSSTAMGQGATASGLVSTAMGQEAIASGDYSFATGFNTEASGSTSTAMGRQTTASGDYSFAIGSGGSEASGDRSMVMGHGSNAFGEYSIAMGRNAKAVHQGSFVWADSQDVAFPSLAANQFAIRAGGGVRVDGATDAEPGAGGFLTLGATSSINLVFDNNEIMARNNGAVDTLNLNFDGGDVRTGGPLGVGRQPATNSLEVAGNASKASAGSWLANSDSRIKQEIQTVAGALDTLAKVRLVSFAYTDAYRAQHPGTEDRRHLNVIAQEFAEVFPDHVKASGEKLPDGSEILQVDTHPLTIYSAAAIQELNTKLELKDAEITDLKARLEKLERLLQAEPGKSPR
jgi:hypothetical protein